MGGWIFNIVFGAILTVACVATAIAFPVVAPFFIGAAIGAGAATVAIALADNHSGDVRNEFEAAIGALFGAAVGATIVAIPYISSAIVSGASALSSFLSGLFPPLSGLPAMAIAGGTNAAVGAAGGTAAIGGVIEQGIFGTGVIIAMASALFNEGAQKVPNQQQEVKEEETSSETVTRGRSRAPETGEPGSIYEQIDNNGNVRSRTRYGENGRPEYRDDLAGRPHFDKKTGQYLDQHRHHFTYNENGQPTGETVTAIPD